MTRIVHISNSAPAAVIDGGSSRENALADFLARHEAHSIIVQDDCFKHGKAAKLLRVRKILSEIAEHEPSIVVLKYPAYPFFWQHKVTKYFLLSLLFAGKLRQLADRLGSKIVVDVMDLPRFQYNDLGFSLEMSPRVLERFDRFVFSKADYIWVCSDSLVNLMAETYAVPQSRLISALNGYDLECANAIVRAQRSGKMRFVYCGSLNKERGVNNLLSQFAASGADAELHLCGPHGEWLAGAVNNENIVYHGQMSESDAMNLAGNCDVGLIPYPETGYYHLAFATKLAFYLGAGIPVLCSMARETAFHVTKMDVGICRHIGKFSDAFFEMASSKQNVSRLRENVELVRSDFAWNTIYEKALGRISQN